MVLRKVSRLGPFLVIVTTARCFPRSLVSSVGWNDLAHRGTLWFTLSGLATLFISVAAPSVFRTEVDEDFLHILTNSGMYHMYFRVCVREERYPCDFEFHFSMTHYIEDLAIW